MSFFLYAKSPASLEVISSGLERSIYIYNERPKTVFSSRESFVGLYHHRLFLPDHLHCSIIIPSPLAFRFPASHFDCGLLAGAVAHAQELRTVGGGRR